MRQITDLNYQIFALQGGVFVGVIIGHTNFVRKRAALKWNATEREGAKFLMHFNFTPICL